MKNFVKFALTTCLAFAAMPVLADERFQGYWYDSTGSEEFDLSEIYLIESLGADGSLRGLDVNVDRANGFSGGHYEVSGDRIIITYPEDEGEFTLTYEFLDENRVVYRNEEEDFQAVFKRLPEDAYLSQALMRLVDTERPLQVSLGENPSIGSIIALVSLDNEEANFEIGMDKAAVYEGEMTQGGDVLLTALHDHLLMIRTNAEYPAEQFSEIVELLRAR
ncbi:hypothetical protein [Fodinicurvata fenggangensis]|uniref:hypothetical protein n=1 Tax=Fodinicurvata fenggangensis TaxID=1121830 RepID=UPI0012DD55FC|nr:hypothetical protein [Fodinicurvata fenggangensis]